MKLNASELYVVEYLKNNYSITLSKIAESNVKTPDFKFCADGKRIFVAELKNIESVESTIENGWTAKINDCVRSASRIDNAVNRVAVKIHEAFKQLKAFSEPKILIFLNEDRLVDINDLKEAFTGMMEYGNSNFSYLNTASKKIANGRIKEEKTIIDLYIWIDRKQNKIFFRYG